MGEKKKVLIAEDEKPLAKALTLKMGQAGFETTTVHDGVAVMDLLDKEQFDLILIDLVMPNMDGFETLKEMKKKSIKVPVMVLSNLSQESDIEKVKELGAIDFIVKSNIPVSEVVERAKKVLE